MPHHADCTFSNTFLLPRRKKRSVARQRRKNSRQLPPARRQARCKWCPAMAEAKRYVYVLRSEKSPERHYVGLSSDVGARLALHNEGRSKYTATNRPWMLRAAIEFRNPASAAAFERFLKSGSGRAFAKRHFV